jgi:hypothetical protein
MKIVDDVDMNARGRRGWCERTNPLTCAYVEEIVEGPAGLVLLQLPERGHLLLPQLAHRDPRAHCKSSSVRAHTHAYTSSEKLPMRLSRFLVGTQKCMQFAKVIK